MFRNTVFYWHLWESLQLTARFFIFHQEIWSNIGKHNDPKRRKSPFAGGGLAPLFQEHFILIFWGWNEKALSLPTPKWPPWTLHLKMYYQKKFKQWCYMVNFTKFMIHMHLCIKDKINMLALYWFDQNYRFFYSKIDPFFGVKNGQKTVNFAIKKSVIFIQSKKGSHIDFVFDA